LQDRGSELDKIYRTGEDLLKDW